MNTLRNISTLRPGTALFAIAAILLVSQPALCGNTTKDKANQGANRRVEVPVPVSKAVDARFPSAKVQKVTKETEGGVEVYDLELKHKGRKVEADILADGTIQNWEEEVKQADVPEAVQKAVQAGYPGAIWHSAMRVNKVHGGKDVLEGYEVQLETLDSKTVEVTMDPAGKVLEDSGDQD